MLEYVCMYERYPLRTPRRVLGTDNTPASLTSVSPMMKMEAFSNNSWRFIDIKINTFKR